MLAAAARRPAHRRTVRAEALLALCEAERARVSDSANAQSWRRAVAAADALGAVAQRAVRRGCASPNRCSPNAPHAAEATAALNEAVALFTDAPGSPIRALAEHVAHRARLRIEDSPDDEALRSTSRFGLTEREADVLRLLDEGRTNREIGAALFISPKTVSVHVSSIMRKLGVRRRADAARIARRTTTDRAPAGKADSGLGVRSE